MITPLIPSTCILLAAGESKRMGDSHKLLLPFKGKPLLLHALDAALAACENVIVVWGAADLRDILPSDKRLTTIHNPQFVKGQLGSLQAGLGACGSGTAFILLGDLPFIVPEVFREVYDAAQGHDAAFPVCNGRRGHPVFLAAAAVEAISAADPALKAMEVIKGLDVVSAQVNCDGICRDIDTPDDYGNAVISAAEKPNLP